MQFGKQRAESYYKVKKVQNNHQRKKENKSDQRGVSQTVHLVADA